MNNATYSLPRRPGPVTATAILNLITGIVGVGGATFILFLLPTLSKSLESVREINDPALTQSMDSLKTMTLAVQSFGIPLMTALALFSAVLIAASIGMLSLRSWARLTTIAIGWIAIAYGLIVLITFIVLQRWTSAIPGEWAAYWILVITLLMSRDVKAAFDRATAIRAARRTEAEAPAISPPPIPAA